MNGRGITLHGVLDLQLVDVDSRRQRGEDEDEQLRRLSPYLHRREISGQRNSYTKVHKLCPERAQGHRKWIRSQIR